MRRVLKHLNYLHGLANCKDQNEKLVSEISTEEIDSAISGLRTNKSAGWDAFPPYERLDTVMPFLIDEDQANTQQHKDSPPYY